jgi:hypothetical protein
MIDGGAAAPTGVSCSPAVNPIYDGVETIAVRPGIDLFDHLWCPRATGNLDRRDTRTGVVDTTPFTRLCH